MLAGDVLHIDVANGGVMASFAYLVVLIVEVDFQYRLLAHTHLDVLHADVLDDTTSARVGLDTQHPLKLGGIHHAVVGEDVACPTADFAADHHTSVPVTHLTTAYNDVLRRDVPAPSVTVPTALDGDTVVSGIEETVLNQHSVAALRVATVAIRSVVVHFHAAYGDIGRLQGVQHPEG